MYSFLIFAIWDVCVLTWRHIFFVVVTAGIQHGSRVVRDLQPVHVVFALLLVNRTAFS